MNTNGREQEKILNVKEKKMIAKQNILYILGAGFSAPLGIPVMSNFWTKAKDMYDTDRDKYGYFQRIFDKCDIMHKIKTHIHSDLTNIEEILSILEMENIVSEKSTQREDYHKFLADVFQNYTPAKRSSKSVLTDYDIRDNDQQFVEHIFGRATHDICFGRFFANLLNLKICRSKEIDSKTNLPKYHNIFKSEIIDNSSINYDVILLCPS